MSIIGSRTSITSYLSYYTYEARKENNVSLGLLEYI